MQILKPCDLQSLYRELRGKVGGRWLPAVWLQNRGGEWPWLEPIGMTCLGEESTEKPEIPLSKPSRHVSFHHIFFSLAVFTPVLGADEKVCFLKLGLIGKGFEYVSPPSSPREGFSYKNFHISLNIVYFHNKRLSRWSLMGLLRMLILNKSTLQTSLPSIHLRKWLAIQPTPSLSNSNMGTSGCSALLMFHSWASKVLPAFSMFLFLSLPHPWDILALTLDAEGTLSFCHQLLSFSVNSSHPHFVSSSQSINHSSQNLWRLPTVLTPGPRYHVERDQDLTKKNEPTFASLHPLSPFQEMIHERVENPKTFHTYIFFKLILQTAVLVTFPSNCNN